MALPSWEGFLKCFFMIKFDENNRVIENDSFRAILVGLSMGEDISYSMDELSLLAEAAEGEVLGQMIQNLERPNTATYIGKGKVEELAEMCRNMEADTVIFNNELSGMQIRNLEEALDVRVIDRTILILDIFAMRATSREGKLQVELAQLQYRMPRLMGFGKSLSRLGGGIGTRGPGEKKLETDRRHIERRMDDIKAEIASIKTTRETQRSRREKSEIPVVALVGYTNSGKSALMNRLLTMEENEEKSVFEKDMLFATLDTSQRLIHLEGGQEFILIDTVGFVSKLPHQLVNAFKATLEEVNYADLLLHVVDSSFENKDFHVEVTEKVLNEIGAGDRERILVYNKIDLCPESDFPEADICVSAKYGDGIAALMEMIKAHIYAGNRVVKLLLPYDRGDIVNYLREHANVKDIAYEAEGAIVTAEVGEADYGRLSKYEIG